MLSGNTFADKYGKNKVTYLYYLARIYRNLNNASKKITKKKFKDVLTGFHAGSTSEIIIKTCVARRNATQGQLAVSEVVGKKDFIRFNANPNPAEALLMV